MEYIVTKAIETLVKERQNALKNYDIPRVTQIRNDLEEINIKLADLREGTKWNFVKNQNQQSHHPQI